LEAGVGGDLAAEVQELVEEGVDRLAVLEAAVGAEFPGFLAGRAVSLFEEAGELLEGDLLAAEVDDHAAADLVVVGGQLGDAGLEGDVGLAEELDIRLPAASQELEFGLAKGGAVGDSTNFFWSAKAQRLEAGRICWTSACRPFQGPRRRLAGVGVVGDGAVLVDGGVELGEVEQPADQLFGGPMGRSRRGR